MQSSKSLYDINIQSVLFLDIETVPIEPSYEDLDETTRILWDKKVSKLKNLETLSPEEIFARAGIYAEFGKIVCISCGIVSNNTTVRIKSFADDDEFTLLNDFSKMLDQFFAKGEKFLCAHNGKEFDFPYIARRMLVNQIRLPEPLQIAGKKPWEISHLDTMELWKFGDYKNYTSLVTLANLFNIPTPKDDIDGSQVYKVYWNDNDLNRIATYCQKDVITIIQLFRKFRNEDTFESQQIEIIT